MTRPHREVHVKRRKVLQWGLAGTASHVLGAAGRGLPEAGPEGERSAAEAVAASLVGGRWQGLLDADGRPVPVELRFERDVAGQLTGVFEARDFGTLGVPLQELALEGDQLRGRIDFWQARLTARVHRDHLEAELIVKDDTGRDSVFTLRLLRDHPAVRPYLLPRLNAAGTRETSYTYAPPQSLGDGWPVGHLEDVGLVPRRIEAAVVAILDGRYPWIESLLIVRRGTLVLDEYFYGRAPHELHLLQSATKSITSLLVGIAIDRGAIHGVELPVHSFFGDYAGRRWVDERYDITLHQALAMSAGLEWSEWALPLTDPRNPVIAMYRAEDWIGYVLDRPPRAQEPGRFEYNSGLSLLLGGVLQRATGQRVDAFAREHLFTPLGIHHFQWLCRPDGTCLTWGGLWLRPRDLAKLGQMVLNGGTWQGQRLVSETWLRASTTIHSRTEAIAYGYQWWLLPVAGMPLVEAWGHGGQFLLIVPRHDLVVVSTAKDYENTAGAVRLLREHILPAVGTQPQAD